MSTSYPRIPYGMGSFERIRTQGLLYVDKTRFVRALEDHRHAFFIRPRRFGKTCWVALLECYYDRNRAQRFDALFAGTDIGADPTPDRSRYVVLRFNFSAFDSRLATLEERFELYCEDQVRHMLSSSRDLFPDEAARHILAPPGINAKLERLFRFVGTHGVALYVLIDEYDNFANTVLAYHGEAAYQHFTHGEGFYRAFFATLKAGTEQGGGIERLFMTGVSPITLDDVTSGFNIAKNISLSPEFNELLGFTEVEVRGLLELYRDLGVFGQNVDTALDTMRAWYDGYRFSEDATTSVYNTDMVLYYLSESIPNAPIPRYLIDDNVRIDYGKLRHLMVTSRQGAVRLNGNFDLLRHIVGEGRAEARIHKSFPLERLARPENFLSLLYYFGLLAIEGEGRGLTRLGIPNQTVRHLMYGYLRDAYDDVELFTVDQHQLLVRLSRMAFDGAWRPVVELLREAIAEQTGIRDYIAGEKVLQGFLAAYLGLGQSFLLRSEVELGKGYADLVLEPFTARSPDIGYGYVIELKYVKRGELPRAAAVEKTQGECASPAVAALLDAAGAQLRGYLADTGLRARYPSVRFIGLALVFHGWELVASAAVEVDAGRPASD